ncbi:pirin family protein [Streptomyces sp. NPDC002643]
MPAITVDDVLVLPRLPELDPAGTFHRPVRRLVRAVRGFEGDGFPVRRAFAGVPLPELDPFVHMDHLGEVEMAPGEPMGTPWHPHRGFETVTYLIDGAVEHQDSNGGGGKLTDGDTQWMTAGAGVLHIEQPPEHLVMSGGVLHGVQLWVNLPRAKKMTPPRYQDIRVNALVYALAGHGTVGAEARPFQEGRLAVFGEGDALRLTADRAQESRAPKLELFTLGGLPIREPVVQYGPFVMNTPEEVKHAFDDYRAGRLGVVPSRHLPHTP